MEAHVYKSQKRADTYVFVADRDGAARLPESLQARLAPFAFVMTLQLDAGRKLAQAQASEVMAQLAERGWYLQMPPSHAADPLAGDWGTDA